MPILGQQDLRDVGGWMLSSALRTAPAQCPSWCGSSPAASKPRFPSAPPDPLRRGDPEALKPNFKLLEPQVFPLAGWAGEHQAGNAWLTLGGVGSKFCLALGYLYSHRDFPRESL